MRTQIIRLLIVVGIVGFAGCKSASQMVGSALPASRSTSYSSSSYASAPRPSVQMNDNDIQFSNLANSGVIISHDLNSGHARVDRDRWNRMSSGDQQAAARVIQQYQNRNSPRPVTIYVVASTGRQASAGW